jgi:hypothetical protein
MPFMANFTKPSSRKTVRRTAKSKSQNLNIKEPLINNRNLNLAFSQLEMKFKSLSYSIQDCRTNLTLAYDEYGEKLKQDIENENRFKNRVIDKYESMLSQLESYRINVLIHNCFKPVAVFHPNKQSLLALINEKHSSQLEIRFDLKQRLRYLSFFCTYETIEFKQFIDENCYNCIMLPLSRARYFFAMGKFAKRSSMKITDAQGCELFRRPVSKSFFYRDFLAHTKRIIGIYDHLDTNMNVIEVYDHRLALTASKLFDHRLDLLYMNEFELVCRSLQVANLYYFFNFKLDQTYSIRVKAEDSLCDLSAAAGKSDIDLLGSSEIEVFIFVRTKKVIKILDRKTERISREININVKQLDLDNLVSCKLDPCEKNLVFKVSSRPRRLKHYDFARGVLTDGSADCLERLNSFEFTSDGDIYSIDCLNKQIVFV